MRADVIAGEVRTFSVSHHLSLSLFGLIGQSNLLFWVRKPEDCIITTILSHPFVSHIFIRPTHFQHD